MAYSVPRPVASFVFSLIAGIIILLVGFIIALAGAVVTLHIGGIGGIFGTFGVLWGIIIIISAIMIYNRPQQHALWGTLVLVFSLISIFGSLGGFFIGLILGLVGGVLGIIWSPDGN